MRHLYKILIFAFLTGCSLYMPKITYNSSATYDLICTTDNGNIAIFKRIKGPIVEHRKSWTFMIRLPAHIEHVIGQKYAEHSIDKKDYGHCKVYEL